MKKIIKRIFNFLGLEVSNLQSFRKLEENSITYKENNILLDNSIKKLSFILVESTTNTDNFSLEGFLHFSADKLLKSKSQLFQDLFVLYFFKEKTKGYFVEFGATNGIELSNTYLLEKEYQWNGILSEPAKKWQQELRRNRKSPIDNRCVWSKSGENLNFAETTIGELSSIDSFIDKDFMSSLRNIESSYVVPSVSLVDLLAAHNAPIEIDYLSIDTEGSELEILQSFDFDKYNITVITVEHNYTLNRQFIYDLLISKNYERVFEKITLFDDWYIRKQNQMQID